MVKEFDDILFEIGLTAFLLHSTTEQAWVKIQKEGLAPQPQEKTRLKWYRENFGVNLQDRVIWLGREPPEVFLNKDLHPIVIALPIKHEKFGLHETLLEVEYVASKSILPEDFLGYFDFTQHPKGLQEESSFLKWLEEMKEKLVSS